MHVCAVRASYVGRDCRHAVLTAIALPRSGSTLPLEDLVWSLFAQCRVGEGSLAPLRRREIGQHGKRGRRLVLLPFCGIFETLEDAIDDDTEIGIFPRRPVLPGNIDCSQASGGEDSG